MKENIGVFDSGMGGITLLVDLVDALPNENFVYFGDSLNAPYGTKTEEAVISLTSSSIDKLIANGAKAIVLACNTATSAAINSLRENYEIPIIGMEPAIKPALLNNNGGNIALMATPMTLKLDKLNTLVSQLDDKGNIIKIPSPKLVEFVENGIISGKNVEHYIYKIFEKYDIESFESIVLGCTHFLYLKNTLKKIFGEKIEIFDGNEGTINQVIHVLEQSNLKNNENIQGSYSIKNSLSQDMILRSEKLYKIYSQLKNFNKKIVIDNFIDANVKEVILNSNIEEKYKKMILMRYGIDQENASSLKDIGKEFNIKGKKLTAELEKAEKLAFSILKAQSFYDIINQV